MRMRYHQLWYAQGPGAPRSLDPIVLSAAMTGVATIAWWLLPHKKPLLLLVIAGPTVAFALAAASMVRTILAGCKIPRSAILAAALAVTLLLRILLPAVVPVLGLFRPTSITPIAESDAQASLERQMQYLG